MEYTISTLQALQQTWSEGLDYVEINGVNFGMFIDGVYTLNEGCNMATSKGEFVFKPVGIWGDVDDTSLTYVDHDGAKREVKQCNMTKDKGGRYWLWSEQLKQNLAYKSKDKEACLLVAIDSLLFTLSMKDKRIASLEHISDLAHKFASELTPEDDNEGY